MTRNRHVASFQSADVFFGRDERRRLARHRQPERRVGDVEVGFCDADVVALGLLGDAPQNELRFVSGFDRFSAGPGFDRPTVVADPADPDADAPVDFRQTLESDVGEGLGERLVLSRRNRRRLQNDQSKRFLKLNLSLKK